MKDYIEMIELMRRTGASDKAIEEFIESIYAKGLITSRGYELLIGIIY